MNYLERIKSAQERIEHMKKYRDGSYYSVHRASLVNVMDNMAKELEKEFHEFEEEIDLMEKAVEKIEKTLNIKR